MKYEKYLENEKNKKKQKYTALLEQYQNPIANHRKKKS